MRGFAEFWGLPELDSSELFLTSSMFFEKGQSMLSEEKGLHRQLSWYILWYKRDHIWALPISAGMFSPMAFIQKKKKSRNLKAFPGSSINYLTVRLFWTLICFNANNSTVSTVYVQSKVYLALVSPKAKTSCQVTAVTTDPPGLTPV